MKRTLLAVTAAALLFSGATSAHEPDKGPNGGRRVDAGEYHVELVANEMTVTAYVTNDSYSPIDVTGFKATGVFVVAGKPQRIEFKHDVVNRLTGASSVALPALMKGALQITRPDGRTVQAKFE